MITKMALPVFGGAPATWAVALCFFQALLLLAARTRRLFTSPRTMRMVNRGTGAVMATAAVAIAAK